MTFPSTRTSQFPYPWCLLVSSTRVTSPFHLPSRPHPTITPKLLLQYRVCTRKVQRRCFLRCTETPYTDGLPRTLPEEVPDRVDVYQWSGLTCRNGSRTSTSVSLRVSVVGPSPVRLLVIIEVPRVTPTHSETGKP